MRDLPMPSVDLSAGLKHGDVNVFEAIVRSFRQHLMIVAENRLDDPELIEKIIQDTFLALWQAREAIRLDEGNKSLVAWLIKVARRQVFTHTQRGRQSDGDLLESPEPEVQKRLRFNMTNAPTGNDDIFDIDEVIQRREGISQVRWAIKEITKKNKNKGNIMRLFYLEEQSISEIAGELRMPANTVSSHLGRGRIRVGKLLARFNAERTSGNVCPAE